MILAVKIQNRQTKEFYCKGGGFGKIGKTWTTLGYAKTAICPKHYWLDYQKKYFIECYKEELNSDFLVITDKGTYTIPVASYFIDYLTREHELDIVNNIKKYCKKNNINLCGYYDETKKYVIELDKESAIKLLRRIIIRDANVDDYRELEDILKEELQADIIKINY